MTTDLHTAAKLALEALESCGADEWYSEDDFGMTQIYDENKVTKAITALRSALANEALDKKADNAREIGLDYEPAAGTQVSKVWWDGEKLMAKPISLESIYKEPEQPAQEVDWEKLYRLEVKKKEALATKYERDTGKQLTRIVPMNQPAQQEPLTDEQIEDAVREADLDWHQGWTLDDDVPNRFTTFARAVEAAHGITGEKK